MAGRFFPNFRREADSLESGDAVDSDFMSLRKDISGRLGDGAV